jgi:hypothetical protein
MGTSRWGSEPVSSFSGDRPSTVRTPCSIQHTQPPATATSAHGTPRVLSRALPLGSQAGEFAFVEAVNRGPGDVEITSYCLARLDVR